MIRRALVVVCALTIALTGCKSDDKPDQGSGGRTKANGGPPSGGWPQPENGRITPKMCGLLTDDDYAKYGHMRLGNIGRKQTPPNGVDCLYVTNDELSLNLQPTAEAAKLAFARDLKEHREKLDQFHVPSIIATDVLPGAADESWFDYWTLLANPNTPNKEYEIAARRGSLLVDIVLSGIHGKTEKDPRTLLTGLATLLLQRIPTVGRTDTGTTPKLVFRVTGNGRARQIVYLDPANGNTVTLKNVKLPWKVTKPTTGRPTPLTLTAQPAAIFGRVGCSIEQDGRQLAHQDATTGIAICQYYPQNG